MALKLGVYTDKNSEGCHDWDTFIRFHNYGIEPKHIPEVLYSWRMHQGSTSSNIRSKNYITNSHQRTLIKSKNFLEVKEVELIKSEFFNYNVDWRYKLKSYNEKFISLIICKNKKSSDNKYINNVKSLKDILFDYKYDYIHLKWDNIKIDNIIFYFLRLFVFLNV